MKRAEQVTADKLRGAYYTPPALVDACLDRVCELRPDRDGLRFLEPSSGDGAFARGLHRCVVTEHLKRPHLVCVEVNPQAAAQCARVIGAHGLSGEVHGESFFGWADRSPDTFDAVVGNPPFVRYQFVPEKDRALAEWLLRCEGVELRGVANLWIPFALLSLMRLRPGGAFALVLPGEIFCTLSAGQVRAELVRRFTSLRVDLYPRDTFPDILQDVVVVSGIKADTNCEGRTVSFRQHAADGVCAWDRSVPASTEAWNQYLLDADAWDACRQARCLPGVHELGAVASVGVAVVTGANDFFTVDDATARTHELDAWLLPLLERTGDSRGLIFTRQDHAEARRGGKKGWLLNFSDARPDPAASDAPRAYLRSGEEAKLPERYKCRIRTPWYRVPHIKRGALLMAKRAHYHHRLLLNEADVYTTDTIYRGAMRPPHAGRERDLVAGFHNSLTLLSAELEGRTYGGGVLELVPSEVARLTVPLIDTGPMLCELDALSRRHGGQKDTGNALVMATDAMLCKRLPRYSEYLEPLQRAVLQLRARRFAS